MAWYVLSFKNILMLTGAVVAWQFYHLAKVLLKLYNSKCPRGVDVVTFNSQVEVCTSLNSASQD